MEASEKRRVEWEEMESQLRSLQEAIVEKDEELGTLRRENGKLHGDAEYQHAIQENNTLKDKIQEMEVKIN